MAGEKDAETLFADYLRRVEAGEEIDFGSWVRDHPAHEEELRQLDEDWKVVGSARQAIDPMAGSFFFQGGERERPIPAPGLESGKVVGDYRLISLIGQGGMGQVWEAAQASLGDRRVAVKFVRPDRVTPRQLELFQREARAGGRLNHPGIVAVHGYGESDGLAWIAMEYVEGCWTLRDFLDEMIRQEELPANYDREVARFIAEVAEAVQAAHEAGVIHRDLKPQNILITKDDHPKVTDFGLARITDESELSKTGDFAGTYFYMSPEQVAARRAGIDHRTDVFSLGAVFYEMLTLRRPFEGDTTHQVAEQILAKDPPDPRTVRSRIPTDLAVIAAKAMEKDRDRRYASMHELAEDLRRWFAKKPIRAREPGLFERGGKWVRRHPTQSLVCLVSGLAIAVISALLGIALKSMRETQEAKEDAKLSVEAAERATGRAGVAERASRDLLYRGALKAADLAIKSGNNGEFRRWLQECPPELRHWEWFHLSLRVGSSLMRLDGIVRAMAGDRVVTLDEDTLRVWNALTGEVLVTFSVERGHGGDVALSADGTLLALSEQSGRVRLLDGATGEVLRELDGHEQPITELAFSPDGSQLASGSQDHGVRLWSVASGELVATLESHQNYIKYVEYSRDGSRLATGAYNDAVCLWDPRDGRLVAREESRGGRLAFSPDSRRIALGAGPAGESQLRDATTGELLATLPGSGTVMSIAFDSASERLVVGDREGQLRIWSAADGARLLELEGHQGSVWSAVFGPDGSQVVSGSSDGSLRRWDARTGRLVGILRGHEHPAYEVSFSRDGSRLISQSRGEWGLWTADAGLPVPELRGHRKATKGFVFSPDESRLLSGSYDETVRLWDLTTGANLTTLRKLGWTFAVAFSPDGRTFAAGGVSGRIHLHDAASGDGLGVLDGHESAVEALAFSPGGDRLVSGSMDGSLRLWDRATGTGRVLGSHDDRVRDVEFSQDGQRIVSCSSDNTLRVWNGRTGELEDTLEDRYPLFRVHLSPDGTRAIGAATWYPSLWNIEASKAVTWLLDADALAFSPTRSHLAVGTGTGEIHLLDSGDGTQLVTLEGHRNGIGDLSYHPDGTRLASASGDGTVRIWDAAKGETIVTIEGLEGGPRGVTFSPGGTLLATGSQDGRIFLLLSDVAQARSIWREAERARRFDAVVDPLLEALFEEELLVDRVLEELESSVQLGPLELKEARRRARLWSSLTAKELNEAAWQVIDPAGSGKGDQSQALQLSRASIELIPQSANFHDTLAWALLANERPKEALAASRRALELAGAEEQDDYASRLEQLMSALAARAAPVDEGE